MNKLQGPYKSLMCLNIPEEREKCVLKKKKSSMADGNKCFAGNQSR